MGLTITGNFVDVDHSHNQLLNTGRHGNPVVHLIGEGKEEIRVYSTFERHKTPRSMSRNPNIRKGDNCHLIYALKGNGGFYTSFGAIRRLMLHFDAIIEDMIDQSGDFDAVIPMPSGHGISRTFAKRLSQRYRCPLISGAFSKISMQDARNQLAAANLSYAERKQLAVRIGRGNGQFSVKDIPTEFRSLFKAVTIMPAVLPGHYQSFLLVDDLLASGSTLVEAGRQLRAIVPTADIAAACLFSAV